MRSCSGSPVSLFFYDVPDQSHQGTPHALLRTFTNGRCETLQFEDDLWHASIFL